MCRQSLFHGVLTITSIKQSNVFIYYVVPVKFQRNANNFSCDSSRCSGCSAFHFHQRGTQPYLFCLNCFICCSCLPCTPVCKCFFSNDVTRIGRTQRLTLCKMTSLGNAEMEAGLELQGTEGTHCIMSSLYLLRGNTKIL